MDSSVSNIALNIILAQPNFYRSSQHTAYSKIKSCYNNNNIRELSFSYAN